MKKVLIKILSTLFQFIDALLCKLHLKRPVVVVFMDGGICSQMLMYLQGQYYAEYGMDVYYDTLFYEHNGKDSMGIMPRTFEFSDMWPNLEFNTLNRLPRKWYLLFFKAIRTHGDMLPEPRTVMHSIYLDGWWDIPNEDRKHLFEKYYRIDIAAIPAVAVNKVFDGVVGVHVRRGDLAKGDNPFYGGVSNGYFLRAIEFCNDEFAPTKYLFFSDEPDWVEQNICNHLSKPFEIIRGNKAWEDLWLLSHCSIIVASQGSFGKVAAQLNQRAASIQCDNEHATKDRKNTYFIK